MITNTSICHKGASSGFNCVSKICVPPPEVAKLVFWESRLVNISSILAQHGARVILILLTALVDLPISQHRFDAVKYASIAVRHAATAHAYKLQMF